MATVSALAGPVTRTFLVSHNARTYSVGLYHDTLLGTRVLTIDGGEVAGTAGRTTVMSAPATLVFTIGDASGTVTIVPARTEVHYRCEFDGSPVAEENTVVDADAKDESKRLKLEVARAELAADDAGKPLVLFVLHTQRETDLRETYVHRRFRDFFAVNEQLRSAYKGSHLLASFPSLPPRGIKYLEDQLSTAFIEKRRWLLQDWLFKLSQIPRMRRNPDFLTFLGIVDKVRETSFVFPAGPLGLTLRPAAAGGVELAGVKAECPVPAAAATLRAGDCVSKVNGEDVLGVDIDIVTAKIKAAHRPLCLHFLGPLPPLPHGAAGASAGDGGDAAHAHASVPLAGGGGGGGGGALRGGGFATSGGGASAVLPGGRGAPLPVHPHAEAAAARAAAAAGAALAGIL